MSASRASSQACRTEVVEAVIRELLDTPPAGRDAVLTSLLPLLQGNRSDRASDLLLMIADSQVEGVRSATVASMARILDPRAVVRCVRNLPAGRLFPARQICEQLHWRDALPVISDLRDGRIAPGLYLNFHDEMLTLGTLLATGNEHNLREFSLSLHRRDGGETIFLFGASRSPVDLLREMTAVNVLVCPSPNHDEELAAWAFANPALGGSARHFALQYNSAAVVGALRSRGLLRLDEVYRWCRGSSWGDASPDERVLAALGLPASTPGAGVLARAAIAACHDVASVTRRLSPEGVSRLCTQLAPTDVEEREIVRGLLPEWHDDARSLVQAARALRSRPFS